ncbi:hypothetical protein F4824DRAFT_464700 [Ustulina deusta]|nr:hypothetical protein F4824DRAFT_464700 [Ustulina deusta]
MFLCFAMILALMYVYIYMSFHLISATFSSSRGKLMLVSTFRTFSSLALSLLGWC